MGLTVPGVGTEPGPNYASEINSDLTIVDQHDHSSGKGVQVTPSGLNISTDLTFQNNNAISLRSLRLQSQSSLIPGSSPDLDCLYVTNNDLYYNDGAGNQVRLTQSGGVAGSPGSISGLAAPASATYVSISASFVWQSDTNIAANLDARSIILRNSSASSKGLTLNPPSGMASDFSITLPTLPASQSVMTIDNTGAVAAPSVYPLTTTGIAAGGVQTTNIANGNVTRPKLVAVGNVTSSVSGTLSTSNTIFTQALQTTFFTTTGRPVMIMLVPTTGGAACYIRATATASSNALQITLNRSTGSASSLLTQHELSCELPSKGINVPPGAVSYLDSPSAGTYQYRLDFRNSAASQLVTLTNVALIAYEL